MCMICGLPKCPGGCPNAAAPEPVGKCAWCGEYIFPGDECYQLEGGATFHDICLQENALDVLTENIGTTYFTAEADAGWYGD